MGSLLLTVRGCELGDPCWDESVKTPYAAACDDSRADSHIGALATGSKGCIQEDEASSYHNGGFAAILVA